MRLSALMGRGQVGRLAPGRVSACVFGLALAACGGEPPAPAVRTVALPAPEADQPAFEPHLAIDPANPDRIVVAAQYGVGYNRGGRKIWTWTSGDGGASWSGATMPIPVPNAVLAADAVTGFDREGRAVLVFLATDSAFRGGAALTRTGPEDLQFGPARIVVPDRFDQGEGPIDKGWLAIDRAPTSPFAGAIYLSWHVMRLLPERQVESTLWLNQLRGDRWGEPTRIGTNFGSQVETRSTGVIDLVFGSSDDRTLLHTTSDDGGRTVAAPDTVVVLPDSLGLEGPTIAIESGDTVAVCWSEGRRGAGSGHAVACARMGGNGPWSPPNRIAPPAGGSIGFPAIAASPEGLWLLAYRSDSASTTVELFRSVGGAGFQPERSLASRPFGGSRFCPAPGAPCRRDTTAYFPGDYFGLAVADRRVAAAYTLPLDDSPTGRSTVFVSLIRR